MELKEINVPEGIVLQIDHEGQFAVLQLMLEKEIISIPMSRLRR